MISTKFLKSSFIYSVVGALPYASGLILIPFFTEKLTPEQFGINALYLSLMYFIQVISTFTMETYIGVKYFEYKDQPEKLKEQVGTVLISLIVIGTFVMFFFMIGGIKVFSNIFSAQTYLTLHPYGIYTIVSAFFNGIFKSYSNLLINQQRPERFFWLNLLNFLLTIGISLLLLYFFPFTLYGPIIGRLIPAIVVAILSIFLIVKEFGLHYNREFIGKIFFFCYPLVIYGILSWIVNYVDRFIILRFMVNPTYVAIYDFGVKITMLIDILQIGLSNALHPKIYSIWKAQGIKESTPEVNRYYNGFTAITLIIIPVFIIAVPLLVPLIVHKEIYYQSFAFIAVLSLGYASRGSMFMFLAPLFYFGKTKVLPKLLLITAIIQIVITVVLIYYFSLWGAVIASFFVKPIQSFLFWTESRKVFTFRVNAWKIFYLPAIFMTAVILLEIFARDLNILVRGMIQLGLSLILVAFAYRKEVMPLLKKIIAAQH